MHYYSRLYQSEADYELMRQLLIQTFPLTDPPLNCTIGDIDWWRSTPPASPGAPEITTRIKLWFDDLGSLIAFTWPNVEHVDLMIRPNHRRLERAIIPQLEDEFRHATINQAAASQTSMEDLSADGGTKRAFHFWSYEQDRLRNATLREFGYWPTKDFLSTNRIELAQKPESRILPAGYSIRSFAGESEIEARVNVHRAAFHPSKMTVERHRRVMTMPTYRQDLDLVCQSEKGTLAAYTIVWFDEWNKIGLFEPVGCHPDFQRKGLASAVMVEGLRRLYDLGATHAYVNSWGDDSAGSQTYKALGFELIGKLYQWKKEF